MSKYYDYVAKDDECNCSNDCCYTIFPNREKVNPREECCNQCEDNTHEKCKDEHKYKVKYIEGPPGPKGERGCRGPKGDYGPRGFIGMQGPQGLRGEIGPQGEPGCEGPQGQRGDKGPPGPMGPQGPIGPTGNTGPRGPNGIEGSQGPQGPIGPYGLEGPPGPQGPMGVTGPQGPRGPKGCNGDVGEQGQIGPQGPIGPRGPKGNTPKFIGTIAYGEYCPSILKENIGIAKIKSFKSDSCKIILEEDTKVIKICGAGYYYISIVLFIKSECDEAFMELCEDKNGDKLSTYSYLPKGGGQLTLSRSILVENDKITRIYVVNKGDSKVELVGYVNSKGIKYASGNIEIFKYQESY